MTEAIQKQGAGTIARQEFGAQSLATTGETVATVLAARAKAEVEARYIVAMQRPRNWDNVRVDMLAACERPGFAGSATDREKDKGSAWYKKPIGKGVEGFSIRFAEEALRCMGNMNVRSTVIWEDEDKRLIEVEVVDLENNISIPTTVVVEKVVERSYLKNGEIAISSRVNSKNEAVYLRRATPDEVIPVQNSAVSKAMRNGILRLLPGDIQTECKNRITEIRYGKEAKDPKAFRRKVSDWFSSQGIKPSDLKQYLGHDLDNSSKAELAALHDLCDEIKSGKTTWNDVMSARAEENGEELPTEKLPMENLTDKLKNVTPAATEAPANTEEKPSNPTGSDNFDPIAELNAVAREMWGAKAEGALDHACSTNNIELDKITPDQAANMLDVLSAQREGYGKK